MFIEYELERVISWYNIHSIVCSTGNAKENKTVLFL